MTSTIWVRETHRSSDPVEHIVVTDLDSFCLALQRDLHEITAVGNAHIFEDRD